MATATPKMEILVDLSKPVEEIMTCIMLIVNSNPSKQLDILRQVDIRMGEVIGKIEEGTKKQTPTETVHTEPKPA